MHISLTFRNTETADWLKDYVDKKFSKLEKYMEGTTEAHVILSSEKFRNVAEINLMVNGVNINSKEEAKDMALAVDNAVDKLERQIKKHRGKVKSHKDNSSIGESLYAPVSEGYQEEEGQSRLLEARKVVLEHMSVDDALMKLEEMNDEVIIYRDSSSENVSIIYQRDDGNYVLVEAIS
jgi:putative sigma-54 modulation protein